MLNIHRKLPAFVLSFLVALVIQAVGFFALWINFIDQTTDAIRNNLNITLAVFEKNIEHMQETMETIRAVIGKNDNTECNAILNDLRLIQSATPWISGIGVADFSTAKYCSTTVGERELIDDIVKMQAAPFGITNRIGYENKEISFVYYRIVENNRMIWVVKPLKEWTQHLDYTWYTSKLNFGDDWKPRAEKDRQSDYRIHVTSSHAPLSISAESSERGVKRLFWQNNKWLLAYPIALSIIISLMLFFFLTRPQPIKKQLARALRTNQFLPYLQPIVDGNDGRWVGAEVLMRWPDAPPELATPDKYIPVAEELGLIDDMTWQIMQNTAAALNKNEFAEKFFISFNVTRKMLLNPIVARECRNFLDNLKPSENRPEIYLEITEQALGKAIELPRAVLKDFIRAGVKFAIDDFGTGYNNLSALQDARLLGKIKIDKTFIAEISVTGKTPLLDAIILIAQSMDLKIIAEGVETELQRRILIEKGIVLHQGYLYAHPMPAIAFSAQLGAQENR